MKAMQRAAQNVMQRVGKEQAQMTAKNLYEQGLTIEQIARTIGFSMDTVEKWLTQKAG